MAADWLSRLGIVSSGKYLKNRTPAAWLPTTTPGIVPQGGVGPTSAPGIQDVYAHPELYGIPLAPGYGQVVPTPGGPTQGFAGFGNYKDWLTNMQAQLNQLPQILAPFKGWLSNLPNLPQSPIPTPKFKYPAPGRPPAPGEPGYQNPFAWRRKNNGWW